MEAMVNYLQLFFEWLIRSTMVAAIVICLILFVQKLFSNKLGPRWSHALWLVLLIRMVLPWTPSSRFSLMNLIPSRDREVQQQFDNTFQQQEALQIEQTNESIETIQIPSSQSDVAIKETILPQTNTSSNINNDSMQWRVFVYRILPFLWLAGAIVVGSYLFISNFTLWRIVKCESALVNQEILELFNKCRIQMNIQTLVVVIPSNQIKSPALFGFIRPRLLLPQKMLNNASYEEMRYVFLHELGHLKRRDIYLGWLTSFLQVLHWFNPLVWLAFYRMRNDRELACDALVLTSTQKEESQEYGRAIVGLLRRFSYSRPLPALAGILENKSQLKRRITMIAQFKKNSYQWSPLAVILIIILVCVSLPNSIDTKASQSSAAESAPPMVLRRIWTDSSNDGQVSPDGRYLSYVDWETSDLNHNDLAIYEITTGKKQRLTNNASWYETGEYQYALSSIWSPDSKQIAYQWCEREGRPVELCIIRIDGSEPRILYSTKERSEWAEVYDWSPDGTQILACLLGKDEEGNIALISVADSSVNFLKAVGKYSEWPKHMCFSPDGRQIVYSYPQKGGSNNHDISVMSTDGSREISLVEHPAHDFVLGWAPDGKNILFASDRTGTLGIWLIAVDDGKPQGEPRMIKHAGDGFEPLGITDEGSFYYGTSTGSDNVYVATLDPETGTITAPPKKAIQRYEGSILAAAYSPDGKYMAYIYSHNRRNTFCVRSIEIGQEREFPFQLNDIRRHSSPRWSPDGSSILVSATDENNENGIYNAGIYNIDIQTGKRQYLVRSHTCAWSADGKTIFYPRSNRNKEITQVVARDLKTGEEKFLCQPPLDKFIFNIALSPDGRWLALRCIDPTSLKILPVVGGESRALPEFEKIAHVAKPIAWTADSRYVLFLGDDPDSGEHPLCRISIESGKVDKLGFNIHSLNGLSAHPDGSQILVSGSESGSESEVWVMENFLPE